MNCLLVYILHRGNDVVVINPGLGDKLVLSNTDSLIESYIPSEAKDTGIYGLLTIAYELYLVVQVKTLCNHAVSRIYLFVCIFICMIDRQMSDTLNNSQTFTGQ